MNYLINELGRQKWYLNWVRWVKCKFEDRVLIESIGRFWLGAECWGNCHDNYFFIQKINNLSQLCTSVLLFVRKYFFPIDIYDSKWLTGVNSNPQVSFDIKDFKQPWILFNANRRGTVWVMTPIRLFHTSLSQTSHVNRSRSPTDLRKYVIVVRRWQ